MASRHIIAVFGFVILVNLFFFRMFGSTALTLLSAGFFVYLVSVLPIRPYIKRYGTTAWILAVLVLAPILLIHLRGSAVIQAGLFLAFLLATGYAVYMVTAGRKNIISVTEFLLALPRVATSHLLNLLKITVSLLDSGSSGRSLPVKRITTIVFGLILGLPVAAILLGLLTGADPIFAKTVSQLTRYLSMDRVYWRIAGSVVALLIAAPFIGIKVKRTPSVPNRFPPDLSDAVTTVIFLMALIAGSFLVVQWPYIFVRVAKETDLTRFGVATYSEYVRRGFAELLTAGVLMYAASWVGYLSERSHTPIRKAAFIIQMVLLGELGVFIISVIRRVLLYWQFHGLTLVRIYGGLFLTTILILTGILILRHIFRKPSWIKWELAAVIFMVAFTGIWNAEHFLVHNHPPTVNNRVDYVYLSKLSPDGYDGWAMSYGWAKDTLQKHKDTPPGNLSEDDLRQLSYAGSIIGTLTRTYMNLTEIYAGSGDRQRASDTLRSNYLTHITAYRADIEHDLALVAANTTSSGRLDRLLDFGGNSQSKKQTLEAQMRKVDSKLTYLTGTGSTSVEHVGYYRFSRSYALRVPDFSNRTCIYDRVPGTDPWCMPEFYTFPEIPGNEPSGLDRIYRWNGKTAAVYAKLMRDIPLPELLELQNAFVALHRQIITRPETAKSAPWDISTETVFLESF